MLSPKKLTLFSGSKALEHRIDEFLDRISEAGITYKKAVSVYIENGVNDNFISLIGQINDTESRADKLRRRIETHLYEQNLIPDLRADVLRLVEDLDELMNAYDSNGYRINIERPDFSPLDKDDILHLVEAATNSVEHAVLASRAFFRDISAVRDHSHKVMYFETEADRISTKIKTAIFRSDLPLANKLHLRDFIEVIDNIADMAEDLMDQLAIYVIKRDI
jgi:predicted phosphate transport protein (TIGR00153 family)